MNRHVLCLGDGNFSYARSLAANDPTGLLHVTATSYDSAAEVERRHGEAALESIAFLRARGHRVLHGIDATLDLCRPLTNATASRENRAAATATPPSPHGGDDDSNNDGRATSDDYHRTYKHTTITEPPNTLQYEHANHQPTVQ